MIFYYSIVKTYLCNICFSILDAQEMKSIAFYDDFTNSYKFEIQ